jgi:ATP-binding cassette, subfamily G (WHITE), member 2, PDR
MRSLYSVLAGPKTLPGFWIFMYRISPFTYLVDGMLSTGLANTRIVCSSIELSHFNPPSGQTCGQYLHRYITSFGGYVENPAATANCSFCSASDTNKYLASLSSSYANCWRNFGIMWAFIIFNVFGAVFFYWLARVPKNKKEEKGKDEGTERKETLERRATLERMETLERKRTLERRATLEKVDE